MRTKGGEEATRRVVHTRGVSHRQTSKAADSESPVHFSREAVRAPKHLRMTNAEAFFSVSGERARQKQVMKTSSSRGESARENNKQPQLFFECRRQNQLISLATLIVLESAVEYK